MFVEAEANKAGGKYDNASIDFQVDFYRKEGLTPYTDSKLPISSGVLMALVFRVCYAFVFFRLPFLLSISCRIH